MGVHQAGGDDVAVDPEHVVTGLGLDRSHGFDQAVAAREVSGPAGASCAESYYPDGSRCAETRVVRSTAPRPRSSCTAGGTAAWFTELETTDLTAELVFPSPREWAGLFNLRYRMLLAYLSHTFRLARTTRNDEPNVRGMMMHRVFGEMYNVKTIADIVVRLPLRDEPGASAAAPGACAGPPFEMPYTLSIPPSQIIEALAVTLGFGLPLVLLAYVFLKNKEVAP